MMRMGGVSSRAGFMFGGYPSVLLFCVAATAVSLLFAVLPFLFARRQHNTEKLSPYECGFDPAQSPRTMFDVKFYIVAMLFVIFDLEVAFLFPWSVCLAKIGAEGFWSMMGFLGLLVVGFIYEWGSGALEWD